MGIPPWMHAYGTPIEPEPEGPLDPDATPKLPHSGDEVELYGGPFDGLRRAFDPHEPILRLLHQWGGSKTRANPEEEVHVYEFEHAFNGKNTYVWKGWE